MATYTAEELRNGPGSQLIDWIMDEVVGSAITQPDVEGLAQLIDDIFPAKISRAALDELLSVLDPLNIDSLTEAYGREPDAPPGVSPEAAFDAYARLLPDEIALAITAYVYDGVVSTLSMDEIMSHETTNPERVAGAVLLGIGIFGGDFLRHAHRVSRYDGIHNALLSDTPFTLDSVKATYDAAASSA